MARRERFSDPILLAVKAGEDLAVDLYYRHRPVRRLGIRRRTGHLTSRREETMRVTHIGPSRCLLRRGSFYAGLMSPHPGALAPLSRSAIRSLTALISGSICGDWPSVLTRRLGEAGRTDVAVINAGISGNQLLKGGAGDNALSRFDRDVLAVPGVSTVIVLEGSNDIGTALPLLQPAVGAAEIIDAYRQLIRRAHAAGLRSSGARLPPRPAAVMGCPQSRQNGR